MSAPPLPDHGHALTGEFLSSSSVSSGRVCDDEACGRYIHEIVWWQCVHCMKFDLCCDSITKERASQAAAIADDKALSPPICGQPLEAGSTDIVVHGHRLREITYTASRDDAQRASLIALHKARINQILGNCTPGSGVAISSGRDVWLLERELNEEPPAESSPQQKQDHEQRQKQISAKLLAYLLLQAKKQPVNILSLDGGGVRGMLPIRVLKHLASQVDSLFAGCPPLPADAFPAIGQIDPNDDVMAKQREFARRFQYIAGTSNGGLLGYALATDVPLSTLEVLYTDAKYWKPSDYSEASWSDWAWGLLPRIPEGIVASGFHWDRAKYDPKPIHEVIDGILLKQFPKERFPNGATMRDVDRLLNSHLVNPDDPTGPLLRSEHHRCVVINTFEAAANVVRMVDSSSREDAHRLLADILKGTMAAPYYFPPHTAEHTYLDGGLYANDPMLTAVHCARRAPNTTDFSEYRLVGIGTGVSNNELKGINDSPPHGGASTWALGTPKALLLNTVLEANRSLTETVSKGLAEFRRTRRIKFNVQLENPPELDDLSFARKFQDLPDAPSAAWANILGSYDMKTLEEFLKHQMV